MAVFECKIGIFREQTSIFMIFEPRILGGVFRTVFGAKFAFSEHRISIFKCRISFFSANFLAQNLRFLSEKFPFSERGILEGVTR